MSQKASKIRNETKAYLSGTIFQIHTASVDSSLGTAFRFFELH